MTRTLVPARWDALPLEKVTEMVARKRVTGQGLTLTQSYLKKGALVPSHAHDGEQMIYVLQGALRARIDGDDVTIREGEVLRVPAGSPHQAEALDDTFVLDVRAPSTCGTRRRTAGGKSTCSSNAVTT